MFQNRRLGLILLAPATLFVVLGFLVPVAILLSGAFRAEGGWTLSHYIDFFAQPLNREVFLRTFRLGLIVTAVAAVVGYGVALAVVEAGPKSKGRLVALLVLPLMISPVARTYAWLVILGRTGFVNVALVNSGILDTPLRLLFTETAVFFKVILPLSKEGLVVGGTLVFVGSLTAYVTPAILGGSKVLMLETLLYQRVSVANDFASAAVIAVILIVMSVATNILLKRLASVRRTKKEAA